MYRKSTITNIKSVYHKIVQYTLHRCIHYPKYN